MHLKCVDLIFFFFREISQNKAYLSKCRRQKGAGREVDCIIYMINMSLITFIWRQRKINRSVSTGGIKWAAVVYKAAAVSKTAAVTVEFDTAVSCQGTVSCSAVCRPNG